MSPQQVPDYPRPEGWSADDERQFRDWYFDIARRTNLDPDPDSPLHFYDYRRAFLAGVGPRAVSGDTRPHWPSEFKRLGHPNLIVDDMDTRTGAPATEELRNQQLTARLLVAKKVGDLKMRGDR